jgi:thiol-disulfide isomerase/thioredoxin
MTIEKTIHILIVIALYFLFYSSVRAIWQSDFLRIMLFYFGFSALFVAFYSQAFWLFPKYWANNKYHKYFLCLSIMLILIFLAHSTLQTIDIQKQILRKRNVFLPFTDAYFSFFVTHLNSMGKVLIVLLSSWCYSMVKTSINKGKLKVRTLLISVGVTLTLVSSAITLYYLVNTSYKGTAEIKFIENGENYRNIQELINLQEFKGYALYIDIWGPNCGPCLNEFKFQKSLKERYKNKPVKYLYLAVVNRSFDTAKWKKIIKENKITGYHMLMSKEFYQNLWTINGIKGRYMIPHYLIADAKGHTVVPNAEFPSSGTKLYQMMDSITNQTLTNGNK